MNREQIETLLAAYLLDELDTATRAEVDASLAADAALRDQLADMRMAIKLVRQGLEEEGQPQLSASRRTALLNAVARPAKPPTKPAHKAAISWWRRPVGRGFFQRTNQSHAQRTTQRGGRPLLRVSAAIAATILLVVGVSFFMVSLLAGRRASNMGAAGQGVVMYTTKGLADEYPAADLEYPIGKRIDMRAGGWDSKAPSAGPADPEKRQTRTELSNELRAGNYPAEGAAGPAVLGVDNGLGDSSIIPSVDRGSKAAAEKSAPLTAPRLTLQNGQQSYVTGEVRERSHGEGQGQWYGDDKTGVIKTRPGQEKDFADMYTIGGKSGTFQKGDKASGPGVKDSPDTLAKSNDQLSDASRRPVATSDILTSVVIADRTPSAAKPNEAPAPAAAEAPRSKGLESESTALTLADGDRGKDKMIDNEREMRSIREAEIPWNRELKYPTNWRELTAKKEKADIPQDAPAGNVGNTSFRSPPDEGKASGPTLPTGESNSPMTGGRLGISNVDANQVVLAPSNHSVDGETSVKRDGTAQFAKAGAGTLTLDGANTYTGSVTITAGTLARGTSSLPATAPAIAGTFIDDVNGDFLDKASKQGLPAASTFREVPVNPWVMADRERFSTFASDVDTASYTLCRSYIRAGYLPPRGAVRMEEFVNAFDYNYPRQAKGVFNIFAEGAPGPFAQGGDNTVLLKIGVQGRIIGREGRKSAHLVFVVDTSGSMATPDRLPLIQDAIKMLADAIDPSDRLTLITFNRQASLVLECVPAARKNEIVAACNNMRAGGPTNLLAGLEAGYALAKREFVAGQVNRVILCTDGAANIGQTDSQAILDGVAAYRRQGITLTVAGFGQGGYNDEMLESLAKKGDGSYMFIDTQQQAREALVEKMNSALQTIAFDSRIQVEFNPDRVRRYRLIGYEKRQIAAADFRNDTIEAARVGSGQSATALYEVELNGSDSRSPLDLLGTVYVRYRNADNHQIEEISHRIESRAVRPMSVEDSPRFHLAACAARFAEILRESPNVKNGNLPQVERVLEHVCKTLPLDDKAGELLQLVRRAKDLPHSP